MVRSRYLILLAAVIASAATASSQTIEWQGAVSDNFSNPANWVGGVAPTTNDTETLEFAYGNNTVLNLDGTTNFLGVQTDAEAIVTIVGSQPLVIGSGSISMTFGGDGISFTSLLTIDAPVSITAPQVWAFNNPGGNLTVSGAVSGLFAIDLQGQGSASTFELNSGASTFGAGNSMSGVVFTGENSYLIVGASSTGPGDAPTAGPLGIGVVQLGDGVNFETSVASVVLANTLIIGDSVTGDPVVFGGQGTSSNPPATNLTFTGTTTLDDSSTEVDFQPNTTVTFNGPITGLVAGTNLNFRGLGGVGNDLVILQGNITNVTQSNLSGKISVIFDGPSSAQVSGFTNGIFSDEGGQSYVGVGAGYNQTGNVATFIGTLQNGFPSSFGGTLGFDTTSGSTAAIFNDPVDISGFGAGSFKGLGSATMAILGPGATITAPGSVYPFGGGGGQLTVQSSLPDNSGMSLNLQAGNAPLTLVLNGALSYTGGTNVDGAALIFDTAPPGMGTINVGSGNTGTGYVGATATAFDDTALQTFINQLILNTDSFDLVVGFDDVSGSTRVIGTIGSPATIDMTGLTNVFLGTATRADYTQYVTITPANSQYRFAGVKGGIVHVESPLTGANSLVVGLPNPAGLESFNLQDGFVTISSVYISGSSNNYTGGTTLNSGYLYVTGDNVLGSNSVIVPDPTDGRTGWVASLNAANNPVDLPNDFSLPDNGIALNYLSTQPLTLSGNISDDSGDHGQLGIYGNVTLSGDNSYSGTTTLGQGGYLYVTNSNSLGIGQLSVFPTTVTPPVLDTAVGSVTVPNTIVLNNGAVLQLNHYGSTTNITIDGPILDAGSGGSLLVNGYATFNGANTFSGGTTLDHALAMVNGPGDLGTGPITIENGSTIDAYATFTLPNNIVLNSSMSLVGTGYEFTLSGQISGNNPITINSPIEFSGNNSSYSGTTLFSNSGLLVVSNNNALGTGPVIVAAQGTLGVNTGITVTNAITLQSGGMLAGYGTLAPTIPTSYTIDSGSIIAGGGGSSGMFSAGVPKPIPGTFNLTASASLMFGPSGILQFSMDNSAGTAGTDYSAINSLGSLTLTTTGPVNPFTIQMISVDPGTKQAGVATFNSSLAASWVLISTTGIIGTFDPTAFVVDSTTFGQGAFTGGTFNVTEAGNDLMLNFTPVPEPSTWAMMASGVLALGAAVRRRRRR
jgi:fibronectin-binding autotransporter adhesin